MANQINKSRQWLEKGILVISFSFCLLSLTGCLPVSTGDRPANDNAGGQKLQETNWLNPPEALAGGVRGIILPHHLLVASFMEKFYGQLAAENSYDRVVILAPNHFGYGYNFVQTTDAVEGGPGLDLKWIDTLEESKTARMETADFGKEHGAYVHYPFLRKYFPKALIVPIIIKNDTPCRTLDQLADKLAELRDREEGRTLILASLDFSHYSAEEISAANDRRTIAWLEKGAAFEAGNLCQESVEMAVSLDSETPDAVAIDSPGVIYVMQRLMQNSGAANFNLWARTSSASLLDSVRPIDNTSHVFGFYRLGS